MPTQPAISPSVNFHQPDTRITRSSPSATDSSMAAPTTPPAAATASADPFPRAPSSTTPVTLPSTPISPQSPPPRPPRRRGTLWLLTGLILLFGGVALLGSSQLDRYLQSFDSQQALEDYLTELGLLAPTGEFNADRFQGEQGDSGEQGELGETGDIGSTGPRGFTGMQGPQGAKGDQGLQGEAGCLQGNCVSLQSTTPGTQETGHMNISGTGIFGSNLNVGGDLTVDTDTFFVDSANNRVGIGTLGPELALHVINGIRSESTVPQLQLMETDGGADENWRLALSGGKLFFQTIDDSAGSGSTKLALDQNGNVGIGTASPGTTTHINGTAPTLRLSQSGGTGNANSGKIEFSETPTSVQFDITHNGANDKLIFNTAQVSNAFVLDRNTGNVGIGTTAPSKKLHIVADGTGSYVAELEQANLGGFSTLQVNNTAPASTSNIAGIEFRLNSSTQERGALRIDTSLNTTTDATRNSLVEFVTNNSGTFSTAMAINGSNVGIGTTSPEELLHLGSGGNLWMDGAGSGIIGLGHGIRSGSRAELHLHANGTDQISEIFFGHGARSDSNVRWAISDRGQSDGLLHFFEGSSLTGGSFNARLTLQSGGNVGIGETNPTAKLQFAVSTSATGGIQFGTDTNLYRSGASKLKTDDTFEVGSDLLVSNVSSGQLAVRGSPLPNVGAAFYSAGENVVPVAVRLADGQGVNAFEVQDSGGSGLAHISASGIVRVIGGSETFPSYAFVNDGDTGVYRISGNNLGITTGGSKIADLLNNAGALGIGLLGAAPVDNTLNVTGTIRQSNATSCDLTADADGDINCISDERLKDVHGSYSGGLSTIRAINPIRYNLKGEDYAHVGFSAQNVQTVLPEATPTQANGYLGLDSRAVLAASVDAIKELDSKLQSGSFDTLNVGSLATINELKVTERIQTVDLVVKGHIKGNADTRGSITVPAGQSQANSAFTKAFASRPYVTLTPKQDAGSLRWWVEETTTSFTVKLSGSAPADLTFNYTVQE